MSSGSVIMLTRQAIELDKPVPCRDGDSRLWFAEDPEDLERAKAYCRGCPLRTACLAGAIERREPCGVWGGEIFDRGPILPAKRRRGRPHADRPVRPAWPAAPARAAAPAGPAGGARRPRKAMAARQEASARKDLTIRKDASARKDVAIRKEASARKDLATRKDVPPRKRSPLREMCG